MGIINDNFMLKNQTAKHFYHDYAKELPIIDYHCHLNPAEIAEDHVFGSITELMLGGDHYKWRFMRSAGIPEAYITGDQPEREKFRAWAKALPYGIGNPLYHWTHLELKRYFDIDEPLTAASADRIFDICNEKLASPAFTAKSLIRRSNVKVICTTDDPMDDLHFHDEIAASGFETKVLPAFRPDKALNITSPDFRDYIERTGASTYAELCDILAGRVAYFHEKGSRLSDHSLSVVTFARGDASKIFDKRMAGVMLTDEEEAVYRTELLIMLGRLYAERDWVMQLHIGATRNNNTRMLKRLGPDAGFDGVGDAAAAAPLSRLLDALDEDDCLPKTILYTLNPKDNYMLGAMLGNFQQGPVAGKMQLGSGWWFCDQRDGMEAQLKALGNLGCLGTFVGMLTDSRSFVSYPRHEYFRRILCNVLGTWVEEGEYPRDEAMLETIIRGICFKNADRYFRFG